MRGQSLWKSRSLPCGLPVSECRLLSVDTKWVEYFTAAYKSGFIGGLLFLSAPLLWETLVALWVLHQHRNQLETSTRLMKLCQRAA